MVDGTNFPINETGRVEAGLRELAELAAASMTDALAGASASPRRLVRMEALREDIGRRALRLLTRRCATGAERLCGSAAFNESLLLAAVAECAGRLQPCGASAALLARAGACVGALTGAASPRRVAALEVAVAQARAEGVAAHFCAQLDRFAELVRALDHARRPVAAPALERAA